MAKIFEAVYQNDDMGFEQLQHLYNLHQGISGHEANGGKNEDIVRYHLERAMECCEKSALVKNHTLTHPMLYGWCVADAPSDNTMILKLMKKTLAEKSYDDFRSCEWFQKLESKITAL